MPLFRSFFMGGFECASHRRRDGVRLDLIRATGHDRHALSDYRACARLGLLSLRDGLRWHRIEVRPGVYDWSSWLPMAEAAEQAGVEIIWDLLHYGAPDFHDQAQESFADALAAFAAEFVRVHRAVTGRAPLACPINEISFAAWAADHGYFGPKGVAPPGRFKQLLARAAIVAAEAMLAADPACRLVWAEPLVHVAPRDGGRAEMRRAEAYRLTQFETYDMLTGRLAPELGGRPELVEAVGLNFYPHNQWFHDGPTIPLGHHAYRPLADMLAEVAERYGRPVFIAETMAEGSARPAWLHYVCNELRAAMERGVEVGGLCLYPVTAYPGWDDSRHADTGLFSVPFADGLRTVYQPLAEELARQRALFGVAA